MSAYINLKNKHIHIQYRKCAVEGKSGRDTNISSERQNMESVTPTDR